MSCKTLFGFSRAKNDFNNLVNHRLRMEKILLGTRCAINNNWVAGELQDDPARAPRRSSRAGAVPCPEHRHGQAQRLQSFTEQPTGTGAPETSLLTPALSEVL